MNESHPIPEDSPENADVNIAFLVAAHHLPLQFHRLVDRLEGRPVVAHIDKKSRIEPFLRSDVEQARRVAVTWGGFSQVEAMLNLMRMALMRFQDATHLIFLSGQDYPVRPIDELKTLLNEHPTQSWIAHDDLGLAGAQFSNIPLEYYPGDLLTALHIPQSASDLVAGILPRRTPPQGIHPWRGSTSWCLTRHAVRHCVNVLDGDSRLRRYYKTIRIPDEIVFSTTIMNSPLSADVAPTVGPTAPLHYIDWAPTRENPAILTECDLDAILTSRRYFIRKVHPVKSHKLLAQIDGLSV